MSIPTTRPLRIGGTRALDGSGSTQYFDLPAHHLATHGVVVGMTGSGKTGLAMVLVEEALRSQIPVLMIDVKGDLPNLLLSFPTLDAIAFAPWIDAAAARRAGESVEAVSQRLADERARQLADWKLTADDVKNFAANVAPRLITPGTHAGEMLHVLSALEHPSPLWESDEELARAALTSAISLVLRLLGRDPDPACSRDHVVLTLFAERRLREGRSADLASLLADLDDPPIAEVGAMSLDAFLPHTERRALSTALNTLLASPTFASWRQGVPLDVGAWLAPREDGKTPAVIVSVAHLDDDERSLVLGLLLDELLTWVRTLAGTSDLRALIVFDEVYGFLPPHPSNPPTKRPLMALLKQARAFGVGVLLATQNPMDLDYRALGNAGIWCVGRLQTDADRARVIEGLANAGAVDEGLDAESLDATVKKLSRGWFVMRDVHRTPSVSLLQVRWALSWLRGPMTRRELRRAVGASAVDAVTKVDASVSGEAR